ncbi:MAG: serine/threonine protein kinase, partial [Chloroflexi bacterium]
MAFVFAAHDSVLDRPVVIKAVELQPEAVGTFIREARTIARLDHPHILDVYDLGTEQIGEENLVYLVMQLASGGTLTNRLREGPLPPNEVRRILYQVGNALDYAHRQGVVHLDLKPANILFDEHGNVLVADFGLAQLLYNANPAKADAFANTLAYMPPEQMLGQEVTPASDVYALGLTLHEMLTGELPEREWTDEGLISRPAPSLPPAIRAVLEKATHHHSGQRYATAGELAEAFAEALARSPSGLPERQAPSAIPPGPSVK